MHPAALSLVELSRAVTITRTKTGGPGGQRRNKVETAASARHEPTGLVADASERRHFEQNRKAAMARLRLLLALRHREPTSLPGYTPSELWCRRASGSTLSVAADHEDVATLLAEALDVLAAADDDVSVAAEALGVSPSRVIKVLRLHSRALAELNDGAPCRRGTAEVALGR